MSGRKNVSPDRTAFDGWPLAYDPYSPPAVHLLALLEADSAEDQALVLLPAPSLHPLPERVKVWMAPTANTPSDQLAWQQIRLPRLAARQAARLHLVTPTPPLACAVPVSCSPAEWGEIALTGKQVLPPNSRPLARRLAQALAVGGLGNLSHLVWPTDLPVPRVAVPLERRPSLVHPLFQPAETPAAPLPAGDPLPAQPFVLYTGPHDPHHLRLLLAGWSWAAPALGTETLLIIPALPTAAERELQLLTADQDWAATVRAVQPGGLAGLAELYQQAALIVHLGPARPWGDPVAAALACAQPLVALDEPLTAARVGPAAYLVAPDQPRALGAAILTVLVEQTVANQLRAAARERSIKNNDQGEGVT